MGVRWVCPEHVQDGSLGRDEHSITHVHWVPVGYWVVEGRLNSGLGDMGSFSDKMQVWEPVS